MLTRSGVPRRAVVVMRCGSGARVDVGRLANNLAEFVDNRLEQHIPLLFWKIPLTRRVYEWVVPAPDIEQMR